MSKRDLISAISVVVIALVIALYPTEKGPSPCGINQKDGCTVSGITFSIEPRPVRAMRENVFRVKVDDPKLVPAGKDLAMHLSMPGMDMGTNRFRLKNIGKGWYSGKGVIPRCPSGKKLWRAAILDVSAREIAAFHFEVE